jgi:hypothetical protein
LVLGEEKMNVARRKETTIGGLMLVRTDSHTFTSKVVFVSWNKATGRWLSCARFAEKSPERRPFVSGVYFGTRIEEPAMTDDAVAATIASTAARMVELRIAKVLLTPGLSGVGSHA